MAEHMPVDQRDKFELRGLRGVGGTARTGLDASRSSLRPDGRGENSSASSACTPDSSFRLHSSLKSSEVNFTAHSGSV